MKILDIVCENSSLVRHTQGKTFFSRVKQQQLLIWFHFSSSWKLLFNLNFSLKNRRKDFRKFFFFSKIWFSFLFYFLNGFSPYLTITISSLDDHIFSFVLSPQRPSSQSAFRQGFTQRSELRECSSNTGLCRLTCVKFEAISPGCLTRLYRYTKPLWKFRSDGHSLWVCCPEWAVAQCFVPWK